MSALYLVAHIDGRGVLIAAGEVESVIDIGAITPAPLSAPAVLGLAALRSRVVTVIDTWRLLGLAPPSGGSTRAIVTAIEGHLYALLVDSLEDVAPFAVAPIAASLALGPCWAAAATGTAERDGEPLLAIDLARLVGRVAAVA